MMKNLNRRNLITGSIAGSLTMQSGILHASDEDAETKTEKVWTLEGELGVHAKFVYRYYLMVLDRQKCALYGADHSRDPEHLSRIQLPARVRVRGKLGTEHHSGGTKGNPSPFPAGWWVYMDVHEVVVLND
jgi:hypothetical protein